MAVINLCFTMTSPVEVELDGLSDEYPNGTSH